MPGDNCAVVGCGSSRKEKGIGIWKLPAPKNEEHKQWRQNWLNELTKTRSIDKDFKKRIENDRVYTCEKHFDPKDIEIYYSDVSISDDKKKSRSRESSQRRVQRPRSSSRREVRQRSDRDNKTDSRSSRESYLVVTITVSIDDEGDLNDDDGNDGGDNDDSDDDSWEHEELPAGPFETPTLEGPAQIPDIPQDTSMLPIPGASPSKRPRSSPVEIRETSPKAAGNSPKVFQSKKVKYDIVPEVSKEMSKEDDCDLDLEEEIANLPIDESFDAHELLNDEDLLLELDEMINN